MDNYHIEEGKDACRFICIGDEMKVYVTSKKNHAKQTCMNDLEKVIRYHFVKKSDHCDRHLRGSRSCSFLLCLQKLLNYILLA